MIRSSQGGGLVRRSTGTIGHPNALSYYFEIMLPLCFAMFLVERQKWLKLAFLVALVSGVIGMFTTFSRGGWITLPVSFPLVFFIIYRNRLFNLKMVIVLFLMVLIGLGAAYFAYPTLQQRFRRDASVASRQPLNLAAFSVIKQYPVCGVGLNNSAEVFKRYDTTTHSRMFRSEKDIQYKHLVHNLYLWVWTEVGTLGLLAFLGIFVATFLTAGRLLFKVSLWLRAVLGGVLAGLLAHLIHGLFDPGFRVILPISALVYSLPRGGWRHLSPPQAISPRRFFDLPD